MRFLKLLRYWLLIIFVLSSVYFGYYNSDPIVLQLPPWFEQVRMPAYFVYFAFLLTGIVLTALYIGVDSLRKSLVIRRLKKKLREFGVATDPDDELSARPPASVRDPIT